MLEVGNECCSTSGILHRTVKSSWACVCVRARARACVGAGKVGKRNERTGISILVLSFTLIKSTSRLEKIYLMCSFKVDGGLLEWVGGLRTRL